MKEYRIPGNFTDVFYKKEDADHEILMLQAEIQKLHNSAISSFGNYETAARIHELEEKVEMMKCCANCIPQNCDYDECIKNHRKDWKLKDMRR